MITDKRLQELIDMHEGYHTIMRGAGDVLESEYADLLSSLKELQQLRKKEDGYALLLKSTNYDLKRQTEYSDKLRKQNKLLIEDGERLALEIAECSEEGIFDTSYQAKLMNLVYDHNKLMESIEAKV